ncbi:P-loop containing nucleoside triphosphate hydrolase protein [Lophiostoma macrostomum CBS 122681]|uniref:P-loop containing nucleoside triphosphate hydrolase protein n=1 Tax=Lophiostoma macrostomum CBS 122681 TaxID=1314788 RepID=A0A6A6SHI6_9PLEO|nr:P-loop containing nucleoside triphosphate hydrolase protein [Lophiostoma macrostomum CBS 122681]
MLESIFPGYTIIVRVLYKILGFDVGLLASAFVMLYMVVWISSLAYAKTSELVSTHLTASIQISNNDDLYRYVLNWVEEQQMTKDARHLKAVTLPASGYDQEPDSDDDSAIDESGNFTYDQWQRSKPPMFWPNFGTSLVWWAGHPCLSRPFRFTRSRTERTIKDEMSREETLDITCFGRSTEPIKELLSFIQEWTSQKGQGRTVIRRTQTTYDTYWGPPIVRPTRPLSTVALDQQRKADLIKDIMEYLHPKNARWYATRGVPYRRGYLLHGSPGTGKSSLSFALAGFFGMPIYCISLAEPKLTESALDNLFSKLPTRSIVLLEDIDAAGLKREDEPMSESGLNTMSEPNTTSKVTGASPIPAASGPKSNISLSGLLNVIDGVAAQEGRILIMTTNCPSKLDDALLRPGRTDVKVEFTLATKEQIRSIFYRMYSTKLEKGQPAKTSGTTTKQTPTKTKSVQNPPSTTNREDADFLKLLAEKPVLHTVEDEQLNAMKDEFAERLPEGKFSPAEIQGFLLSRQKEPFRALAEVAAWRDQMLAAKEKNSKIF